MTKDELRSKFEDCFDDNTRTSEGGYGPDVTDKVGMWWAFDPIVSEYAKQIEEYWKTRCLAAEDYIAKSPCDPDITKEQIKAHEIWSQLVHNQFIEQQNKSNG